MKAILAGRKAALMAVLATTFALTGCYYTQAVRGQLQILHRSEAIEELVAQPDTPAELARRLRLVESARDFSVAELGLPDNDSYRNYADLGREFVVWNVFAAPEFSVRLREWCFPVAGCVGYRGYFAKERARRKADELRAEGLDVAVGGVPAYSTLGRFDDPVLNTMLRQDDVELVAMMFHELAHQVLYVKDDTTFNESFATVVEEAGIDRWLQLHGHADDYEAYRQRREFREHIVGLVDSARTELESLYRMPVATSEMRRRKAVRLDRLSAELREAFAQSAREAPDWVTQDLNNARLASMALYNDRVPEFRSLLEGCGGKLSCFYEAASELAQNQDTRERPVG